MPRLAVFVLWSSVDLWLELILEAKPHQKLGASPASTDRRQPWHPVVLEIWIQFRYWERQRQSCANCANRQMAFTFKITRIPDWISKVWTDGELKLERTRQIVSSLELAGTCSLLSTPPSLTESPLVLLLVLLVLVLLVYSPVSPCLPSCPPRWMGNAVSLHLSPHILVRLAPSEASVDLICSFSRVPSSMTVFRKICLLRFLETF